MTLNQQTAQNCSLDIYIILYNITLNIPTCFDPQGTINKDSNHNNS
jgi:hypothetical protein